MEEVDALLDTLEDEVIATSMDDEDGEDADDRTNDDMLVSPADSKLLVDMISHSRSQ